MNNNFYIIIKSKGKHTYKMVKLIAFCIGLIIILTTLLIITANEKLINFLTAL